MRAWVLLAFTRCKLEPQNWAFGLGTMFHGMGLGRELIGAVATWATKNFPIKYFEYPSQKRMLPVVGLLNDLAVE
ncbi:hypothetical protein J2W42_005793 [Rhizobium tibeticum]|nr:hypothetical protein [Rhizobium tibeticum]